MWLRRGFRATYPIKASFAKITKNNDLQDAQRFANLVAAAFAADIQFGFLHTQSFSKATDSLFHFISSG